MKQDYICPNMENSIPWKTIFPLVPQPGEFFPHLQANGYLHNAYKFNETQTTSLLFSFAKINCDGNVGFSSSINFQSRLLTGRDVA
jgi:hypothetical protein